MRIASGGLNVNFCVFLFTFMYSDECVSSLPLVFICKGFRLYMNLIIQSNNCLFVFSCVLLGLFEFVCVCVFLCVFVFVYDGAWSWLKCAPRYVLTSSYWCPALFSKWIKIKDLTFVNHKATCSGDLSTRSGFYQFISMIPQIRNMKNTLFM